MILPFQRPPQVLLEQRQRPLPTKQCRSCRKPLSMLLFYCYMHYNYWGGGGVRYPPQPSIVANFNIIVMVKMIGVHAFPSTTITAVTRISRIRRRRSAVSLLPSSPNGKHALSSQQRYTTSTKINLFRSPKTTIKINDNNNQKSNTGTKYSMISKIIQQLRRLLFPFLRTKSVQHPPNVSLTIVDDDDNNIRRMEDIGMTKATLPEWMKKSSSVQQVASATSTLLSKQQQQPLPHSTISSNNIMQPHITEDDKLKFVNAALQSHNIHIPSLTKMSHRRGDIVEPMNHGPSTLHNRHDIIPEKTAPHLPPQPSTITTTTRTGKKLKHPTTTHPTEPLEQQWIDRILNDPKPFTSMVPEPSSPILKTPQQQYISSAYTKQSPFTAATTTDTVTTPTTTAQEIYWNNRKAMDLVQQRLIHLTMNTNPVDQTIETLDPPPKETLKENQGIKDTVARSIRPTNTSDSVLTSIRNKIMIHDTNVPDDTNRLSMSRTRTMNANTPVECESQGINDTMLRPTSTNTSDSMLTSIQNKIMTYDTNVLDDTNRLSMSSTRTMNANTAVECEIPQQQQQQQKRPAVLPMSSTPQKKIIRMQIPLTEPDDVRNDLDPNVHGVDPTTTATTTTPTKTKDDPDATTTTPVTKQQLDRAKMWGIDMSKFG